MNIALIIIGWILLFIINILIISYNDKLHNGFDNSFTDQTDSYVPIGLFFLGGPITTIILSFVFITKITSFIVKVYRYFYDKVNPRIRHTNRTNINNLMCQINDLNERS